MSLVFTVDKGDGDKDFWSVAYSRNAWGGPKRLPEPIDSAVDELRPCFQPDGTIWLVSSREGGMNQLHKATMSAPDSYRVSKSPPSINSGNWECDAHLAAASIR